MNKDKLISSIYLYLDNGKLKTILFAISLIVMLFLMLFLNIETPLFADDLIYKCIFNTTQQITGFRDIIESQYIHYNIWGGRSVVHTIAQVLLMFNSLLADIINSVAFLIFILLIYFHINYKRPLSLSLLIGIFLLIWFLEPFAETILWITGSANYMWGTLIIMLFILPYRIYSNKKSRNIAIILLQSLTMGICGIIAGWTNENTGAAMIVMIILFMVRYKLQKIHIPLWAYCGVIGAMVGYTIMIIAPGNAVRAQGTETTLFLIIYRFFRNTQALINTIGLLSLAFVILATVLIKIKQDGYKNILQVASIYKMGALAAVYVMVFSPAFPPRAWFGIIVFCIIALGILVVHMDNKTIRNIKYGFISLGILSFTFNTFDVYKDVTQVNRIMKGREELILDSKKEGKEIVILEPYQTYTKYAFSDPTYGAPILTMYYGIEVKYK